MFCGILCSIVAIVCGACYLLIAIKVRKSNKKSNVHQRGQSKKELKLVIVGVVLMLLAACCAASCTAMAYGISPETMVLFLPFFNLFNDMWSWSPPYLLLGCSKAVRQHMKAVLCCKNVVEPLPVCKLKKRVPLYKSEKNI